MRALRTIPVLRIFDEAKAREFYVGFLGFQVDFEHRFGDNFPLFMQVSRDGCVVRLSEHHGDACPGAAVTFLIEGIADLRDELAGKDYRYAKPDVTRSEWNTLDMAVVDPFGNRLAFSESVPSPA
jgi:catechol 2,3-dioxygenase-like lactoylglutathione lyase family enzyme